MKNKTWMQKLLNVGVYIIIVIFPFSLIARILKDGNLILKTRVPLVDILIWLFFLVWVIKVVRFREFRNIKLPPIPIFAFLVVAVLSTLSANTILDSFKDLVQLFDYLFLGYLLFTNNITSRDQVKKVITLLGVLTTILIIYGIYHYTTLDGKYYLVRSAFDNRNVFSFYLTILIPLFFAFITRKTPIISSFWFGAIIIVGLSVLTSISSFFTILIVLSVIGYQKYRDIRINYIILAVFILIAIAPVGVRLNGIVETKKILIEPSSKDEYVNKVSKSIQMSYYEEITNFEIGGYDLHFSSNIITPRIIPADYIDDMLRARKKEVMIGEINHINQRFLEWQAAMHILKESHLLGAGIGNYRHEIGHHYFSLPKLNTIEPDSQNGYLITASSMGLFGLGVFIWIIYHFLKCALNNLHSAGDSFIKDISLGLLGSLLAFSVSNIFSPLIYQVTAVLFVLIVSLICIVDSLSTDSDVQVDGNVELLDPAVK